VGDFEEAVSLWRERSFPAGSEDDDLDELHADIALADSWIADAVIPYVDAGLFNPPKV
jgi:hypothetical protein